MRNEKSEAWIRGRGPLFFLNLVLALPTFAQQAAPQEAPAPATTPAEKKSTESTASQAGASATPADYIIGEQDVLVINVWKEPELSGAVIVRPDGKITLPLVNEIRVVGMTPVELQNMLNERLKPFLNTPQVTISVREINSRKVYVIGQVGKEGSYHINSSTTVLQIIAEAGGLKDFANRKKIYVLRTENGKQSRYPFNYEDVVRGKSPKQDIILRPGDTIVVP
jgi:polysaccharide export outer membrane protein